MTTDYQLSDRYLAESGTVVLTGVQALARLPIEQLRRDRASGLETAAFLSGYPGSPLGGFDLEMSRARRLAPDLPIVHQPATNEELGATAVMGSQLAAARPDARYDGVVGYWYGKAPGLDRASDAIRHSVFAGTSATSGAVAMVGDDPAAKSSTMPSSSDATLADFHMPIFYPGTIAECVELGLHAVAASRATGLWSAMKIVTPVADGSGTVDLPVLMDELVMPTVEVDGKVWERTPSALFLGSVRMQAVEREFREVRMPLARRYGIENRVNRITVDPSNAWIGLVATGFTYYEMRDALRRLGLADDRAIEAAGIRLLQLRMPVPFDHEIVRRFAEGLDEILVIEEKNPTLERLIKETLYGAAHQPKVTGKTDGEGTQLMRSWGRLDADAILPGLRSRLEGRIADRLMPPEPAPRERVLIPLTAARTPFFCSGCPHNWGTKAPDGSLVGSGTGCHGMSMIMEPDRVGETIGGAAMGTEAANWIGMAPFVDTDHLLQNTGDGTFFHSASLSLLFAIASGVNMTFKILYNSTVAMTGGQDQPGVVGIPELCRIVLAYGAKRVRITTDDPDAYIDVRLPDGVTVHHRRDIVAVQEELAKVPGVTVLIHDQECAAELRRDRRRGRQETPTSRVVINPRICEGCGDCGDVSNCLSVQPFETPFGRKTRIDQASCNFDYSCVEGDCPAFMTIDASGETGTDLRIPADTPTPQTTDADLVSIRMAGIGGTGVVTVAQILATAAMFDGWQVHGLDQTGLSQKAGPVISDITLTRNGVRASNLVGAKQADLILGFDALVAASDRTIRAAAPGRTVVVASTHETPTGRMISAPETDYPRFESLTDRFAEVSRANANRFPDSAATVRTLLGSVAYANVFMLGVAVQEGHVPVSIDSIDRAIALNGVAVDSNRMAFGWGRLWAHDRSAVEKALAAAAARAERSEPSLPDDLAARVDRLSETVRGVVEMLTADLVDYQNVAYATRYVDRVEAVAAAESGAVDGSSLLTEAVAVHLHKLMAYKDEYEVARLALLAETDALIESVGGPGADVTWHLHPPLLKSLGMKRKMQVRAGARATFRALRAARRLRGTALDPFGRTGMRRLERQLVTEYETAIDRVVGSLDGDNLTDAVALAELPDMVRGYEELKEQRAAEFRAELAERLADFG